MKVAANKLNDELRDEIVRYIGDFIANLPAGAKIEATLSRGQRQLPTRPDEGQQWDLNDTWTVKILVNGGAKDEPL